MTAATALGRWLILSLSTFAKAVLFNAAIAASSVAGAATIDAEPLEPHAAKEVIVGYNPEASARQIAEIEVEFSLEVLDEFPDLRAKRYALQPSRKLGNVISALSRKSAVRYAEPNFVMRVNALGPDQHFIQQWYLENGGQTVNGIRGTPGIDINYRNAANIAAPWVSPLVAVVDSGIAIDHPEILGSLADLGWDYVENRPIALDQNGHGSLIASLIAGVSNNGIGGNGISTTAKVLPIRVGNDEGNIATANAVRGLQFAYQSGANIVNCSFSSSAYSTLMYDAIALLRTGGALVVAASGNGGTDGRGDNNDLTPTYPASYALDNIIAVAAIDADGRLAHFSNFGQASVDIAAPGTNIFGADIARKLTVSYNFNSQLPPWTTGPMVGSMSSRPWSRWVDPGNTGWVASSVYNGTLAIYENGTNTHATTQQISLGIAPTLVYRSAYDLEYGYDYVVIEISTDFGLTWSIVDWVTGSTDIPSATYFGTRRQVDLSGYDFRNVHLRFRLQTDGSNSSFFGFFLHEFFIQELNLFAYDGSQYTFNNGTSFAAPLVAGVAAMIWAERPDLSYAQVRSAILSSTRQSSQLAGKVGSGGYLDSAAALARARQYSIAGVLSNPPNGASVSGVGVIGGYHCTSKDIDVYIDGASKGKAGAGTTIGTQAVCGRTDTGYSLLYNFSNLTPGLHVIDLYADGRLANTYWIRSTQSGGQPFLQGVQRVVTVSNFPSAGRSARLEWVQTYQNFVVTGLDGYQPPAIGASAPAESGSIGVMATPTHATTVSGIGVIAGYHCTSKSVEIFIDGVSKGMAGSGTTIGTQSACGRTDTGYSLLYNFNNLTPGLHTVEARAGGATFALHTVNTVQSGGTQFLTGVEWRGTVPDFPSDGKNATIEWKQTLQNFVITSIR